MPSLRRVCRPCRFAVLAVAAACSGRHAEVPPLAGTASFAIDAPLCLDAPLRIAFAVPLDPASWREDAVQLVGTDGPGAGVPVRGRWRIVAAGLEFVPSLALVEPVATSGGLQPGTRYELRLPDPTALRAVDGRPVASATFRFTTRAGTTAAELFAPSPVGGPRLVALDATPRDVDGAWQLGRAFVPSTLRLHFDQPLQPGAANLAAGALQLDYDDPVYGAGTAVAADAVLVHNDAEGAIVELRPRGVLPSAAELRLHIAPTLRDLHGEDHAAAFVEPVRTVRTESALAPQHDALVFDFAAGGDLAATDFAEVPAVVVDGALSASTGFPAVPAEVGDWVPLGAETLLHTDCQLLVYQSGAVRECRDGVLHVRNLHIPAGHTVRGVGPNPLVLVVDGDARIDGLLTVAGGDAVPSIPLMGPFPPLLGPADLVVAPAATAAPAVVGAPAGPAGGHGGCVGGNAETVGSAAGASAAGAVGGGGWGGGASSGPGVVAGGGGGGAGMVAGDPWFPLPVGSAGPIAQYGGHGGGDLGGAAGAPWCPNGDPGDDFWGRAWVPQCGRAVLGELPALRGGSGGGSGGGWNTTQVTAPVGPWLAGGGGGGGGGVLVVQVRGRLTIGPTGRVVADGGNGVGGGGGPFATRGSGGGGGGGTIVLMAGAGVELHVRGETFANRDYDFCLSADGGVCRTHPLVQPSIQSKYPANGQPVINPAVYGANPLGGFGGMGLVQLMVPVGRDNADGTNTVLDDAIDVVRGGVPLLGAEKQRYLGWRGFPDEQGVLVDDFGVPTGTVGGQGDIRPDPVLLPVPWAAGGAARARSTWLPLGALHRRPQLVPDGLPRGVVGIPTTFGAHAGPDGWLPGSEVAGSPSPPGQPRLPMPFLVVETRIDSAALGVPTLALELAADLPAAAPGSYTGCLAELAPAVGGSWVRRRVVHSTVRTLWLEGPSALPDGATQVQLYGWFADVAALPPGARVRIGFAFHRGAAPPRTSGFDADRYPNEVGRFLFDLTDPAVQADLRAFGPRALQWEVLFDGAVDRGLGDPVPPPALQRFFLPVRF
ncbi:MAG: hypothetical protein JNL08_21145 [Planctomycetes bacterium]|nr:hypothetical protein [Planctomycetota bacterium]